MSQIQFDFSRLDSEMKEGFIAVDLALLPPLPTVDKLVEMSQVIYKSWPQSFVLGPARLPHLTLYQGFIKKSNLLRAIHSEALKNLFYRIHSELNSQNHTEVYKTDGLEFQKFRPEENLVISMVNFINTQPLKNSHEMSLEVFRNFEAPSAEIESLFKNAIFSDEIVIPEAYKWVLKYSEKRRALGFSPHVTLGFGSSTANESVRKIFEKPPQLALENFKLSLGQLGNFCTYTHTFCSL